MSFIWNLILILLTFAVCAPIMLLALSAVSAFYPLDPYVQVIADAFVQAGISVPPWLPFVLFYCAVMTLVGLLGTLLLMFPPVWGLFRYFTFHSRKPNEAEKPILQAVFDLIAERSGQDVTKAYRFYVYHGNLNAFATGRRDIYIADSMFAAMDVPAIAGIIAHEIGHHVHGDTKTGLLLQSISIVQYGIMLCMQAIVWICNILSRLPLVGIVAAFISIPLGIVMLISAFLNAIPYRFMEITLSRRIEFAADAHAVKMGLGEELAQGLQILLENFGDSPWFMVPFIDHPRSKSRIEHLRKLMERERQKAIDASISKALRT